MRDPDHVDYFEEIAMERIVKRVAAEKAAMTSTERAAYDAHRVACSTALMPLPGTPPVLVEASDSVACVVCRGRGDCPMPDCGGGQPSEANAPDLRPIGPDTRQRMADRRQVVWGTRATTKTGGAA
jgi:hypothetical protein